MIFSLLQNSLHPVFHYIHLSAGKVHQFAGNFHESVALRTVSRIRANPCVSEADLKLGDEQMRGGDAAVDTFAALGALLVDVLRLEPAFAVNVPL